MKTVMGRIAWMLTILALGLGAGARADAAPSERRPLVQMAILLDTSGSMDGLIDQARAQLWKIVNGFAAAKKNGRSPELQVALYEYGNSGLSSAQGYMRRVLPLTGDLDKVSEALFKLSTNGGEEYCGAAIQAAVAELSWSAEKGDLKLIFIAGNEPFSQGPVDFRGAVKAAVAKGITVNTVYCGIAGQDDSDWRQGAKLADGRHIVIDHNASLVHIPAPQDDELSRLGARLNETYLAFGAAGAEGRSRQSAQDKAAKAVSGAVMAMRAAAKAAPQYSAAAWDLVDAVQENRVKLEEVKEGDLSPELKKLPAGKRRSYIEGKARERKAIQEKIRALSAERDAFLAESRKQNAASPSQTLGTAIIRAIREQAARADYTF